MINISEMSLINFIPQSLKSQEEIELISEIWDEVKEEFYCKKNQLFLQYLEYLPEAFLDELAYEEHVDFYETSLTREQKIELIRSAESIHQTKGTKYSVETALDAVLDDFSLQEWFEYDGEPGKFILLGRHIPEPETLARAERIVNSYKRASAHIDPFFGLLHDTAINIYNSVAEIKYRPNICGTLKENYIPYQATLGRRYLENVYSDTGNYKANDFLRASENEVAKSTTGKKYSYELETSLESNNYSFVTLSSQSVKNDKGKTYNEIISNNIFAYNSLYKSCSENISASEV